MKTFISLSIWLAVVVIPNFLFALAWGMANLPMGFGACALFGLLWGIVLGVHDNRRDA